MIQQSRRGFLVGLGAMIAAPAVVRAASLMPVRGIIMDASPMSMVATLSGIHDAININMLRAAFEMLRANSIPPYYLKDEAYYAIRAGRFVEH